MTSPNTALIIGASSGVGRATALSLAAQQARVFAVARSEKALEQLKRDAPSPIEIRAGDATDPRLTSRLLAEARPDLVVVAAGCRPKTAPVDEHSWETFSEAWNQDLKMAFEIGQAALRLPLGAGSTVVFVSSGAGLNGSPLSGGYAGAKRMQMFLAGYLQGVSEARGLGIRFVAVVPKQLIEGTAIAEIATSAYAARSGVSPEKYMERFGAPLTPHGVAEAIVAVARGELAEGATILGVAGKGTEIL